MPLQQRQLLWRSRFFHGQGMKDLGLFGAEGRDAGEGLRSVQADLVMLDCQSASNIFQVTASNFFQCVRQPEGLSGAV